jgi:mono/diheme cytochrome c family protein
MDSKLLRASLLGALVAVTFAAHVGPAKADWREGRRLARQWCSGCHQVEPAGAANEVAPSFLSIANNPALTTGQVEVWLSTGHELMPDLHLSRAEIDVITEYLATLRR